MRRVYAVWLLRQLASPLALKSYVVFLLGLILKQQVSIIDVLGNTHDPSYFLYAFAQTETLVQIATLGLLVVVLWFAWNFARSLFSIIFRPLISL